MARPLRILTIAAEVSPFAKTGGLGDVASALPKALAALGHDVRVVMPAYAPLERDAAEARGLVPLPGGLTVPLGVGPLPAGVLEGRLPGTDVPVHFIGERRLFDRPSVYGYDDDPYRFSFLSRAALALPARLGWYPDVVHAHDWHAAPAVLWLATAGRSDPAYGGVPSIFTIHNLAHQGRASRAVLRYLGADAPPMLEEGRGDELNFMARGIYHATMISTVSPTYAREILTADGGHGLDGLLRYRHFDVHGILNGLDLDVWNPATDRRLVLAFDARHPERRAANKAALQERLGLPVDERIPLAAMVTRLDAQKGLDITGHVVHMLMSGLAGEAQFVVLGTGDPAYEDMFRRIAGYHARKMAAVLAFSPDLAPLIYGGSDLFLMPSRFEPCGLGQMIAMRYGSVPVVRATGGLADTVRDGVTGFSFSTYAWEDFWRALQRALFVYKTDHDAWRSIRHNGMLASFSWADSARAYVQLYEWALARLGR